MKTYIASRLLQLLIMSLIIFPFFPKTYGQVVVNDKNLNDDESIEYIQLTYYIDKKTFRPVYFIEFGHIPTADALLEQITVVNGTELTGNMTPAMVLNELNKAGWEYLGDALYVQMAFRDNWYTYTLRRKKQEE